MDPCFLVTFHPRGMNTYKLPGFSILGKEKFTILLNAKLTLTRG